METGEVGPVQVSLGALQPWPGAFVFLFVPTTTPPQQHTNTLHLTLAHPRPLLRGVGGRTPLIERREPAARIGKVPLLVQGGRLPDWENGVIVGAA